MLRAAPEVAEALKPRIAAIAHEEGFEGRVQVSADPPSPMPIAASNGAAAARNAHQAALEEAIDELIARHFSDTAPVQLTED